MGYFEIIIKCISCINYATACNCTVGMREKICDFIENAFLCFLPERICIMLINNHYTLGYLNHLIRKNKVLNEKTENDDFYGVIKEAVKEDNAAKIVNENTFITNYKCCEQIDKSAEEGNVLGIFIKSILNILGIMSYSNYVEGVGGLIKCAKWNHYPSMIILSYLYILEEKYDEALYWLNICTSLDDKYNTTEMIQRRNILKQNISTEDYNKLLEKVDEDVKKHKILKDDKLNKTIVLNKINSHVINILYSNVFNLDELNKLFFSDYNIRWSQISEITNAINTHKDSLEYNLEYNPKETKYKIFLDELKNSFINNETGIVIVNYKGTLLKKKINEIIGYFLKGNNLIHIGNEELLSNKFKRLACDMNLFYNAMINAKNKSSVVVFELGKKNDEKNNLIYDFLYPNERYYFEDIDLSFDKRLLKKIILVEDLQILPKSILDNSKVVRIKNLEKEEKVSIIKNDFMKNKRIFSCEHIDFSDEVYEYFYNIPENNVDENMYKLFASIEKEENKTYNKKDVEMILAKKEKVIGFI